MRKVILALGLLGATVDADEMSKQMQQYEQQNVLSQLQEEIQKQEKLVSDIKNQIVRTDVINPSSINSQFENAYTMLNVKKTLYANFVGTPSLQSPLVQQK